MDQTDGVFTGSLNIETSDGFVSSSLYPDKFLSTTKPAENTQTIAGPLVMGAIKAQDITATQLKVSLRPCFFLINFYSKRKSRIFLRS